jgi:hypothetical protein
LSDLRQELANFEYLKKHIGNEHIPVANFALRFIISRLRRVPQVYQENMMPHEATAISLPQL